MKASIWTAVFLLMILEGAAAAQESNEETMCKNLGLAFHQVTSWKEQGTTMKQSLEGLAAGLREGVEGSKSIPKEAAQSYQTFLIGVVVNVYEHAMYKSFGPEMNRNIVQSRCEKIGAANFIKEIDTEMRKLVSRK